MTNKVESVETKQKTTAKAKPRAVRKPATEESKPRVYDKKNGSGYKGSYQKSFTERANSAPKDYQLIKDNIEQKIKAFFESNKGDDNFKQLVSVSKLMEARAHIGLPNKLWNPKMKPFIYFNKGSRNQIIDILKILVFLNRAYNFLHDITKQEGRILFVGTHNDLIKEHVKEEATRTKSFFINQRWLGGTLTNFKTVNNSINKLNKKMNLTVTGDIERYSKKEQLMINKEIARLNKFVGGIRTMRGLPQVIVVTDPVIEHNAVAEARKLHIPVVAITNTNADPNLVDFVIPANSNSIKTVWLIISILADAIASAQGEETKIVGKTDDQIVLPETVRQQQQRRIVDHRARPETPVEKTNR